MNFQELMREKSDEELLKIVTLLRFDYQPEAVATAEEELKNRNITFEIPSKQTIPTDVSIVEYAYAYKARFWEYLIDYIVLYIISFFIGLAAALIGISNDTWLLILGVGAYFLYYFLMESYNKGKTIGKILLKTHVVDISGNYATKKGILIRSLCRFIPFEIFSFIFGGKWENGNVTGNWHDKISKTYVVYDAKIQEYNEK